MICSRDNYQTVVSLSLKHIVVFRLRTDTENRICNFCAYWTNTKLPRHKKINVKLIILGDQQSMIWKSAIHVQEPYFTFYPFSLFTLVATGFYWGFMTFICSLPQLAWDKRFCHCYCCCCNFFMRVILDIMYHHFIVFNVHMSA